MRMPPDQLPVQVPEYIDNRKVPGLISHLGIEQYLQEQVTQFFGQIRPMLTLDRVQHLVGLFQGVPANRGKALLAVPRAPARRAQLHHDRHALLKERAGVGGRGAFLLVHVFTLTDVRYRRSPALSMPSCRCIPTRYTCPASLLLSARERSCCNADPPDRLCVALRPCPRQLSERLHQPPASASIHRAAGLALPLLPLHLSPHATISRSSASFCCAAVAATARRASDGVIRL